MEQVNLDVWTLLVSDASSTVLEKLLQCIDFNNPPDFYDFSRSQRDLALRGGDTSGWTMLLDSQIALRAICRPAVLSEEQAWDLVQSALDFDPLFGGKLVRHLLEGRLWPGEVPL